VAQPAGEVKYFNSLDVWKVVPARAGQSAGRNTRNTQGGYNNGGRESFAGGSYGGGGSDPRADLVVPRDYDGRGDERRTTTSRSDRAYGAARLAVNKS